MFCSPDARAFAVASLHSPAPPRHGRDRASPTIESRKGRKLPLLRGLSLILLPWPLSAPPTPPCRSTSRSGAAGAPHSPSTACKRRRTLARTATPTRSPPSGSAASTSPPTRRPRPASRPRRRSKGTTPSPAAAPGSAPYAGARARRRLPRGTQPTSPVGAGAARRCCRPSSASRRRRCRGSRMSGGSHPSGLRSGLAAAAAGSPSCRRGRLSETTPTLPGWRPQLQVQLILDMLWIP